jgi:hypothetical protein
MELQHPGQCQSSLVVDGPVQIKHILPIGQACVQALILLIAHIELDLNSACTPISMIAEQAMLWHMACARIEE